MGLRTTQEAWAAASHVLAVCVVLMDAPLTLRLLNDSSSSSILLLYHISCALLVSNRLFLGNTVMGSLVHLLILAEVK